MGIPSLGWKWATIPKLVEAPLLVGELWLNGNGGEGVWVALEANVSQGIHGQHNNMQGRSVLRVTPHPPFIAFPRGFRVLSPWSGL